MVVVFLEASMFFCVAVLIKVNAATTNKARTSFIASSMPQAAAVSKLYRFCVHSFSLFFCRILSVRGWWAIKGCVQHTAPRTQNG